MHQLRTLIAAFALSGLPLMPVQPLSAQQSVSIDVNTTELAGKINPLLYGQLFEHIYFSANNGVWQELVYGRSFEPEHYPGIAPRDGYFDGWFADDDGVLHSPTRYEQPISLTTVDSDSYDISMQVKWRSYLLPGRLWSGGLMDLRFAVMDSPEDGPYFVRVHDPRYEGKRLELSQTQAQIDAANRDKALKAVQKELDVPNFSVSVKREREVAGFGGRVRSVVALEPLRAVEAKPGQIEDDGAWHDLKISCRGRNIRVYWDGKQVLSCKVDAAGTSNEIVLWENYTEAQYRDIRITSADGSKVYFSGLPEQVKTPDVAPHWTAFGDAGFSLVKGDAVNMDYAQKIVPDGGEAGIFQGPQDVEAGETFVGSVYAKGTGRLKVGLMKDGAWLCSKDLGTQGAQWRKLEFELPAGDYSGDADFAIAVNGGEVTVDQASLSTATGRALGGFRPDILEAVKQLHPTCLRWPGGGYVAQYNWKWGIGPQEERQRWAHWMWLDYDQNAFGTDEFIRFCREIDTEPVIVVSVGFDRPESEREQILQNACDWVAYCNEPATGKWGSVRAANGHPEPYNVKYWEIDNEMWEMGIERYEECVREFSTAMRKVDPDIKIIACGGFRGEDEGFLMRSGRYFDYMSLHHYEQAGGYATGPERLHEQYLEYADMIAKCPNPNIKLFLSEWNLNSIDWRTGLFAGGFLNMCEQTDVVAMGAAALFLRRTDAPDWNNAFINFDYKGLFVAPNYQVTKLWHDHFSTDRLGYEGDTKDLSLSVTRAENASSVIVKIVNASEKPYRLDVGGDWKGVGELSYEYYAPGSLTVANSMEDKDAVSLREGSAILDGGRVTVDVEPLSAGVLVIGLE